MNLSNQLCLETDHDHEYLHLTMLQETFIQAFKKTEDFKQISTANLLKFCFFDAFFLASLKV